jgi:hypothetical protein
MRADPGMEGVILIAVATAINRGAGSGNSGSESSGSGSSRGGSSGNGRRAAAAGRRPGNGPTRALRARATRHREPGSSHRSEVGG